MGDQKKTMILLELADGSEHRVKWFDNPSSEELTNNIRSIVGLAAGTPFQLLDESGAPVIITSQIPNCSRLKLVTEEQMLLRLGEETSAASRGTLDPYDGAKLRARETVVGDREATGDALGVGKNEKAMKTLRKQKDWGPPDQVIVFSENAQKVNEKFKHQTRLLLVTNLAVFNVDPDNYSIKRRIDLRALDRICTSCLNDDYFMVHVPSEYDYMYQCKRKSEAILNIQTQYAKLSKRELPIEVSNGFSWSPSTKLKYSIVFTMVTAEHNDAVNIKVFG